MVQKNILNKVKKTFPNNYLDSNFYTIKIGSVGCGYEMGNYLIDYIFSLAYPERKIIYENSEDCDVIIYTHFTRKEVFWNKDPKPFILWNGEKYNLRSNFPQCSKKCIISSVDINADLNIPFAFFAFIEYKKKTLWLKYKNINISTKKLFAYCISAYRGPNPRNDFIDAFTQKTQFVWALGRYKTKDSIIDKVSGKWNDEILQKKYSEFKFVLAAENKLTNYLNNEK